MLHSRLLAALRCKVGKVALESDLCGCAAQVANSGGDFYQGRGVHPTTTTRMSYRFIPLLQGPPATSLPSLRFLHLPLTTIPLAPRPSIAAIAGTPLHPLCLSIKPICSMSPLTLSPVAPPVHLLSHLLIGSHICLSKQGPSSELPPTTSHVLLRVCNV